MGTSKAPGGEKPFVLALLPLLFCLTSSARVLAQSNESPRLRTEVTRLPNGAELITLKGEVPAGQFAQTKTIPLMAILRDTLGDQDPENDAFRYLWFTSSAKPTWSQRTLAAVPFLYHRFRSRTKVTDVPSPLLDLSHPRNSGIARISWWVVQRSLFDSLSGPLMAVTRTSATNYYNYKQAQVARALLILNMHRQTAGSEPFGTEDDLRLIGGALAGQDVKGTLLSGDRLEKRYEMEFHRSNTDAAINWDLLRQRAEDERLIFEPLPSLNGQPYFATLWIAKGEASRHLRKDFNSRFLNIANPWTDPRVTRWSQYSKRVWITRGGRLSAVPAPEATEDELIPLAVYALDFPKIPALLVDFRDTFNPKKREITRRALYDVARYALDISFGITNPGYFVALRSYDYLTLKKGLDYNQQSRQPSYARLKTALMLDNSLDPSFREFIRKNLDRVTIDPLENDSRAEAVLAEAQYHLLRKDLSSPRSKILARLDHDRAHEKRTLVHGSMSRFFMRTAWVLTAGRYDHHEKNSAALGARYDLWRRVKHCQRVIRSVAANSSVPEIDTDVDRLRRVLQFFAEHGHLVKPRVSSALARIFAKAQDDQLRRQCLAALFGIGDNQATLALGRIAKDTRENPVFREMSQNLLSSVSRPSQPARAKAASAPAQVSQ